MLLYLYQIFSSLRSHLHFLVHFFFIFMEHFFFGHPISYPRIACWNNSLQTGEVDVSLDSIAHPRAIFW